jgi:phosphoribosylamine--glycine ligase
VVVVGPEVPLCRGIVDSLGRLAPQVSVFGPKAPAARIEGDKAWAKQFMTKYDIPTPQFSIFNDSHSAIQFIRK